MVNVWSSVVGDRLQQRARACLSLRVGECGLQAGRVYNHGIVTFVVFEILYVAATNLTHLPGI